MKAANCGTRRQKLRSAVHIWVTTPLMNLTSIVEHTRAKLASRDALTLDTAAISTTSKIQLL
jgi:hypothetical protein